MSSADAQGAEQGSAAGFYPRQAEPVVAYQAAAVPVSGFDAVKPEAKRGRERFIPVTRFALIDRLTAAARLARQARPRMRAASSAISTTGAASNTTPRCTCSRRPTSRSAPTAIS